MAPPPCQPPFTVRLWGTWLHLWGGWWGPGVRASVRKSHPGRSERCPGLPGVQSHRPTLASVSLDLAREPLERHWLPAPSSSPSPPFGTHGRCPECTCSPAPWSVPSRGDPAPGSQPSPLPLSSCGSTPSPVLPHATGALVQPVPRAPAQEVGARGGHRGCEGGWLPVCHAWPTPLGLEEPHRLPRGALSVMPVTQPASPRPWGWPTSVAAETMA